MANVLRGEVRWADLNPVRRREQGGRRPVLILSRDVFNDRSGTVVAVTLTSQPQGAGFPLPLAAYIRGPAQALVGQDQSGQDPFDRAAERGTRARLTGGVGSGYRGAERDHRIALRQPRQKGSSRLMLEMYHLRTPRERTSG